MQLMKFSLLLVFAILLLLSIVGGILNITQLASINLPVPILLDISLFFLAIYLLLINAQLRWQLSRKRDMQSRIDELARFRQQAITTLYAVTPTRAEFPEWLQRYKTWEDTLVAYLQGAFPFAVFEMFEDLGLLPYEQFNHTSEDPTIRAQHLHYLQMLAKHIRIMERLIEQNTSLLAEASPGLGELLKWLPGE